MDYERIDEIIKRTDRMYGSAKGALIQIKGISDIKVTSKPLNGFGLPENMEAYLDYLIEKEYSYWNQREEVNDDVIPSVTAKYGIAEHSAFMGGTVSFTEDTSWHHKYIEDYGSYTLAKVDSSNIWRNLVIEGMKYMGRKTKGDFFVRYRGADGPMDVVNALRGNDIFYDFYDEEENLVKLAALCTDAIIYMLKEQQKAATKYKGYIISGFDVLLPETYAGHLSVDSTTMLSADMFRKFEMPFIKKIAENFDGLFFHTHSVGSHVIPVLCELDKIRFIEISNDPNAPRSIEIFKKYEKELEGRTVIVTLRRSEIEQNIGFLRDKKTVIWYDAQSVKDACEAINLVRENFE
jgi:hypothetical protein